MSVSIFIGSSGVWTTSHCLVPLRQEVKLVAREIAPASGKGPGWFASSCFSAKTTEGGQIDALQGARAVRD